MLIELSDDAAIALTALSEITGIAPNRLADLAMMSGLHSFHAAARSISEQDGGANELPKGGQTPSAEDWRAAVNMGYVDIVSGAERTKK